jgi:trimethylamine--corrinoid protein Co-methyltransferase
MRIAGSEQAREKPFLSLNINHAVTAIRALTPTPAESAVAAVQSGIPVMVNTFGQMGASCPSPLQVVHAEQMPKHWRYGVCLGS